MNKTLSKYLFYYPVTLLRGELVWKYFKQYEQQQWKSNESLIQYQAKSLQQLLQHVADTVPYYRRIFSENNIAIDTIKDIEQLKQLPILSKSDIVKYSQQLHSNKCTRFKSEKTTGGSTGQAVTISKNANALARERAVTWRAYKWAGIGIGDKQARFWGVPLNTKRKLFYQAIDYISNRTRLSAFNLNQRSFENYYRKLVKLQPAYLYGYVSMIVDFATFINENNYPIIPGLKCIITTSEVLNQGSRKTIETAFQSKVFNEYGCGEVGSIAHECEYGNMHIMSENVIVEIDHSDSPDETSGRIIVTDLHNYVMPLIRYDIGDYATLSNKACECGRNLPVIEKIHGRAYDVIKDPDGNKYHPEALMYIFEDLKSKNMGIKQFQVIQKGIDLLEISIIKDSNFNSNAEAVLTQEIKSNIHPDFRIIFHYTDIINREASGKLRIIKSEI